MQLPLVIFRCAKTAKLGLHCLHVARARLSPQTSPGFTFLFCNTTNGYQSILFTHSLDTVWQVFNLHAFAT